MWNFVAICATGVGFLSEATSPPRSAEVKTRLRTPWEREASIIELAWASSTPGAPWTVTRKTLKIGVGVVVKISEGEDGSPLRRVIRGSSAAMDLLFEDVGERVRARIWAFGERAKEERRAVITEWPWVPVAPMTRMVC